MYFAENWLKRENFPVKFKVTQTHRGGCVGWVGRGGTPHFGFWLISPKPLNIMTWNLLRWYIVAMGTFFLAIQVQYNGAVRETGNGRSRKLFPSVLFTDTLAPVRSKVSDFLLIKVRISDSETSVSCFGMKSYLLKSSIELLSRFTMVFSRFDSYKVAFKSLTRSHLDPTHMDFQLY